MLNKIKYLGLIIIIGGLVIPQLVSAQAGTGAFDLLNVLLGGIEEIAGPITAKLVTICFFTLIANLALLVSSALLTYVVSHPEWLTLQGNPVVEGGWHFVAGIADMFLILILIAIALSFILKIETFQIKTTLRNLILVALLINFSLLFVRIFVDIATIFYHTIISLSGVIVLGVTPLIVGMQVNALLATEFLAMIALTYSIPVVSFFMQVAVAVLFPLFIPLIAALVFQAFIAFLLSGIFFTYTFLFAARILIIQLFAIIAPLAFVTLILPQTQKYWRGWLKVILEWTMLGVALLFFVVLGFWLLGYLVISQGLGDVQFSDFLTGVILLKILRLYIFYYFFLFIFLLIMAIISKKLMPIMAEQIIEGGRAAAKMVWGQGLKPAFQGAGKEWIRTTARFAEAEKKAKEEGRWATMGRLERFGFMAGRPAERSTRWLLRRVKLTPKMMVDKEMEEKAKKWEEKFGEDIDTAATFHPLVDVDRAAQFLYLARVKGAKGMNKLSKMEQREDINAILSTAPYKLKDVVKHKSELILGKISPEAEVNEKLAASIQAALVPMGLDDPDVKELIKSGVAGAEAIKKAAFKKVAKAMGRTDFPNLDPESLGPEMLEAIAKYRSLAFARSIGDEVGRDFMPKMQTIIQNTGLKEVLGINPTWAMAPYTAGGELMGLRHWVDEKGNEIREEDIPNLVKEAIKEREEKIIAIPLSLKELRGELEDLRISEMDLKETIKEAKRRGLKIPAEEAEAKLKTQQESIERLREEIKGAEKIEREKREMGI